MVSQVQYGGLANITAALVAYASKPSYLQWGTSSAAVRSANVVTTTTTTEARTAGSLVQGTTTQTNDNITITGTITAAGARAITEVGCFDSAGASSPPTGGNMCLYGDFSVINLAINDSIAFTVKCTFT